jgi:hypothetical protein
MVSPDFVSPDFSQISLARKICMVSPDFQISTQISKENLYGVPRFPNLYGVPRFSRFQGQADRPGSSSWKLALKRRLMRSLGDRIGRNPRAGSLRTDAFADSATIRGENR